jgi:hypothetical protein
MALTPQQIAGYALAAGFPQSEIPTAVAVALAESGGNPGAVNRANSNGSVDYGLFQINTVHGALLTQGDKFDPAANARMAFTVYSRAGNKWTPWSVYKSGRYRAFMPQGTLGAAMPTAPSQTPQANAPAPSVAAATVQTAGVGGTLDALTGGLINGLGGLLIRLGLLLLGSAMILVSVGKITGVSNVVIKQAQRVVPL